MRAIRRFRFLVAICVACFCGQIYAREPTTKDVLKGVRRAVTFHVTPDSNGRLDKCSVVEVRMRDIRQRNSGAIDTSFSPSAEFIAHACKQALATAVNWIPAADPSGEIQPVREDCLWSKAVPNTAICRAELALFFAEEIPKGIGTIVVFELKANENGDVVSCDFSGKYGLSGVKEQGDTPHRLYVEDGCRKLKSVLWRAPERPALEVFYMPCRHIEEVPARAFCEQRFGQ